MTNMTIRANLTNYPLLSDSGVFQADEGYERILIVKGWHPEKPNMMAELNIRVDRVPGLSYAITSVWAGRGWQPIAHLDHREFWEVMSGYLRWANDKSDQDTARLASNMISDLVALVEDGEVEI